MVVTMIDMLAGPIVAAIPQSDHISNKIGYGLLGPTPILCESFLGCLPRGPLAAAANWVSPDCTNPALPGLTPDHPSSLTLSFDYKYMSQRSERCVITNR
jgi:hypothetical protein